MTIETCSEELAEEERAKFPAFADHCGDLLEKAGWTREVAGDYDFNLFKTALAFSFSKLRNDDKKGGRRRGLFFVGAPGCGKTLALKTMEKLLYPNREHSGLTYCKRTYVLESLNFAMEDGDKSIYDGHQFLDDIGVEDELVKFGKHINVIADYVQEFYSVWEQRVAKDPLWGRFYGSTNLDSNKLEEKYGGRTMDRIYDMCVVVKFEGGTKRERHIFQ